jgi:hypothetical protein
VGAVETIAACVAAAAEASQALKGALGDRRNDVPQVIEALRVVGVAHATLLELQRELNSVPAGLNIAELVQQNGHLRAELEGSLFFRGNAYWRLVLDREEGPFCSCCWEAQRRLLHLHESTDSDRATCPNCKTLAKVFEGRSRQGGVQIKGYL